MLSSLLFFERGRGRGDRQGGKERNIVLLGSRINFVFNSESFLLEITFVSSFFQKILESSLTQFLDYWMLDYH